MTISSYSAARRVCAASGWKCTNLQLQKILYIAQMIYMGENDGARLMAADFEAWDYGPVIPEIYRRAKAFGSQPIDDVFTFAASVDGTSEASALDEVASQLLLKRPSELVAITHWKDGAWAKHYIPGAMGVPIPDADILMEYKKRADGVGKQAQPA